MLEKIRHIFALLLLGCFLASPDVIAVNVCSSSKIVEQGQNNIRTIYSFTCTSVDALNPTMPTIANSAVTDFNEMKLSPNFYNLLPLNQICQFKNVYTISLSSNAFTSLTNAFKLLSCLSGLKSLDFSYNSVSTPILSTDFADSFAYNLVYLNLNNNQIPYIQSQTFTYTNGTPRFPNLIYLGLANNQLKKLDLLWPLTLPNILLEIDMKNNPIDSLVNELGKSYSNAMYAYPVAGYRHVDVTNNNLQSISDWNLLQYGLTSASTFYSFLNMILNYDLRPANQTPALTCYCPPAGLYTNTWYQTFYTNLTLSNSIFQLYCQNIAFQNVFSFPCSTSSSNPATTSAGNLIANGTQTNSNLMYLFLLLLLVPIAFIVFMILFCCCFGRACQSCTFHSCSCVSLPCLRPDNHSSVEIAKNKIYDATVCYNESDETWVNKEFISKISEFGRGYKLNKVTINQQKPSELEKEFQQSKRIVLIFSNRFVEREWKNKRFHDLLTTACIEDPNNVLIAINNSNLADQTLKSMLFNLRFENQEVKPSKTESKKQVATEQDDTITNQSGCASCWHKMKGQTKRNLSLDDIEVVNFNDRKFWKKILYVMPHKGQDGAALETGRYKRRVDSDTIPIRNEGESSSVSSSYNINEITRMRSRRSSVVSPEPQVTLLEPKKSVQKPRKLKKKKIQTSSNVSELTPESSVSSTVLNYSPSKSRSSSFKDAKRRDSFDQTADQDDFGALSNLGPLNQL